MAAGGGGGGAAAAYVGMGEAHRRILEYLNRFLDSVSNQDGRSLSRLFSISSDAPGLLSLSDALNTFQDANGLIRQSDECSQYTEIIQAISYLSRFAKLSSEKFSRVLPSF